jgi:hypothetical protein
MHNEKDIIEQLEQLGYSSEEINAVVHKIMLLRIEERKKKAKPLVRRIFHFMKKLCGKALCLLRTQYAKKPKNPV